MLAGRGQVGRDPRTCSARAAAGSRLGSGIVATAVRLVAACGGDARDAHAIACLPVCAVCEVGAGRTRARPCGPLRSAPGATTAASGAPATWPRLAVCGGWERKECWLMAGGTCDALHRKCRLQRREKQKCICESSTGRSPAYRLSALVPAVQRERG